MKPSEMVKKQQSPSSIEYVDGVYDIQEYLEDLDVGDMSQTPVGTGETWAVCIAEGPWGWWASIYTEAHDTDVSWFRSKAEAISEASDIAENMETHDDVNAAGWS